MATAKRVAGTRDWDKYAPGLPDKLSEEQREILGQLLARVPRSDLELLSFPLEPPEHVACRFLRARKFDVEACATLVGEAVKYVREKGVKALPGQDAGTILGCEEDELLAFYPKAYWPSFDKEGRPIFVERTGVVDIDSMLMLSDMDKLVQYHLYCNETGLRDTFRRASERAGRPITTLMSIMDMEHMTMKLVSAPVRNFVGAATGVDGTIYPETLGKMLIINAPSIFTLGWKMVSGFLDERTVRKIEILGGPAEWRPRMEALVDKASIPEEYGGTLRIPGGLFPPGRTRKTMVTAGKTYEEIIVVRTGQVIRFKWFSRPGDIRFSLDLRPAAGGEPVSVHKLQDHPHSDKEWVILEYTVPQDGSILALWDNSRAWFQREVFHRWDFMVAGRPECASQRSALAGGEPVVATDATVSASA